MTPYYILVAAPILCAGVMKFFKKDDKKLPMFMFFAIILFLLALRHIDVGGDLKAYKTIFELVEKTPWKLLNRVDIEYGFAILNKIISIFTSDFRWVMIFSAFITILPIGYLFCQKNEGTALTIALYLNMSIFAVSFSGIRQMIAVAIVTSSFYFIKNRKLALFLIMVFVAFLFHKSALIALILYPLYHLKISKVRALFVLPIVGFIFIFNKQIFTIFVRFLGDDYEKYGNIKETGAYTMIVLFVLFTLFAFLAVKDKELDEETMGLRNFLLLTLVLQMFAPINNVAMRMNYYSIVFVPILIPKVINRGAYFDKKIYKLIYWGMTVFFLIYYFAKAYTGADTMQIYPYRTFWE